METGWGRKNKKARAVRGRDGQVFPGDRRATDAFAGRSPARRLEHGGRAGIRPGNPAGQLLFHLASELTGTP